MTFYQSEASVSAMGENYFAMETSSRIPVNYRFNKEKYEEMKSKGFRLEF